MRTILLLICSNILMTFAWYGNLKFENVALWKVVLISWSIAFFEYWLLIPANRIGFREGFSGYQLKMIQEVITLTIFAIFAVTYLKEPIRWNYIASFVCILGAVYFMFIVKS